MKATFLWIFCAFLVCSFQMSADQSQNKTSKRKTVDDLVNAFTNVKYFWQQQEVAHEMITLGDKKVIPKIEKYLKTDDRKLRCNVALVLAGLGEKRGFTILINELEDKKPRPTDLRRLDGQHSLGDQISQMHISEDRGYAAALLGQLKNREAVFPLIRATQDEMINTQAAISLGEIGDKSAIPALRKMTVDFPSERIWAAYGLASLGESQGFDILTEVIRSSSVWTDRRHAIEFLGMLGDSRSLPIVIKALKDKHVNVRVSAAQALGKIGDPKALPALVEALSDTEVSQVNAPTTVQKEAAKAIETIKPRKN